MVKKELIFLIKLFLTCVLISLVISMLWFLGISLKNHKHQLILKFNINNNINSAGLSIKNLDYFFDLKEPIMNNDQILNFYNDEFVKRLLSVNSEISKDSIKIVLLKNQQKSIITVSTGKAMDIKYVEELSKNIIKDLENKIYKGYKTHSILKKESLNELIKIFKDSKQFNDFFLFYNNNWTAQHENILSFFFDDQKRFETSLFDYEIFQDYEKFIDLSILSKSLLVVFTFLFLIFYIFFPNLRNNIIN